MDINGKHGGSVSDDVCASDSEAGSTKADLRVEVSSNGEAIGVLGTASEVLMRTELDLACSSEKLINLNVLAMHVLTRETDFEAFVSDKEYALDDSVCKASLEFYLLSGILDSEVEELDRLITMLQIEVASVREMISSCKHSGDTFLVAEEKLRDSEKTLKQSKYQISEIRMQSSKFQRILSCQDGEENWNGDRGGASSEDGQLFNMNKNLSTAEQQRHILRMLEKSLAREIDLEQKMSELRQIEEELKVRLLSSEQEAFFIQEEATDVCARWFEAENAAEVMMGISKDLLGLLQISQLNLTSSAHRESQLISKLEDSKKKFYDAESRVNTAEETCKELNEELKFTRDASKKVNSLDRQLRETDIRLQHAVASAEASQENETMLHSVIKDMENLIEDLKLKISRAESRADSAEDKCIILSETNADLNEELSFLRSRLECLESSLNHAEETKTETAKDIGLRTKVITDLLIQLAIERERLHKQISSLVMENQILVSKLLQKGMSSSVVSGHDDGGDSKEFNVTKSNVTAGLNAREINEEENEFSASASECKTEKNVSFVEKEVAPTDSDSASDLGRVRRIDSGALNFKHFLISTLVVLLISSAFYLLRPEKCPF